MDEGTSTCRACGMKMKNVLHHGGMNKEYCERCRLNHLKGL